MGQAPLSAALLAWDGENGDMASESRFRLDLDEILKTGPEGCYVRLHTGPPPVAEAPGERYERRAMNWGDAPVVMWDAITPALLSRAREPARQQSVG
jgi:hypothetical protein